MPLRHTLHRLALAFAVTLGVGLAAVAPGTAEARDNHGYREHPIYNAFQPWFMVDRDQNGKISSKEWKWAEKHGYDRLQGVPKRHLSRKEYQRYLDQYLVRRDAENQRPWRQYDNRPYDNRPYDNRPYDNRWSDRSGHGRHQIDRDRHDVGMPWYAPTKGGSYPDQRGGHRAN